MECPTCASKETLFKSKLNKWLCTDCNATFDPPLKTSATLASVPKRIFFSYGHDANKPLIDRFKADLESRGHSVWIDYKQLGTWDDWKGGITRGIHNSQLAVAFLSLHSTRDPGVCRNEVAMALHHFGTVYPILVEKLPADCIPPTIQHLQWPDLSDWQTKQQSNVLEFERYYEERLLEIVSKVEGDASRFASEIEVLRRVLNPSSFDGKFAQHIDGFIGRQWIFDAFDHWLNHKPDSRVFWITAGPGFGKTAFAVNLANRYRAAVVGTWFCEHGSIDLTNPLSAIRSLSFQLALRWDDYRVRLLPRLGIAAGSGEPQIRDALETLAKKNLADTFSLLISEPLAGLIWREHKLVILMDALDEATESTGDNALAALINGRFIELPPWICFVVTSRPESAVIGHLQRFKPFEISAEDPRNTDDLRAFCERALSTTVATKTLTEIERQKTISLLVHRSEGMVLYLRMVMEGFREGTLAIDDLAAMASGLVGLYGRYHAAFAQRFGSEYAKDVQPLLRLVMAAPGPLPLNLAAQVLPCGKESTQRMRTLLGAYLVESSAGLTLFHKTLHEWLESESNGMFFTDTAPAQVALGIFFWNIFGTREKDQHGIFQPLDWETHVLEWLPKLIRSMPEWDDCESLSQLAEFLKERIRLEASEFLFRRALEKSEKAIGRSHLDTLVIVGRLAVLLRAKGEYDAAEPLYRRALEGFEKDLGPNHPHTLSSLGNLAILLRNRGEYDTAEYFYRRALEGYEKTLEPYHLQTLGVVNNLANLLSVKANYAAAEHLHRRALEGYEKTLGPDHPTTLISVNNLGRLLILEGEYETAKPLLCRVIDGQKKSLGPNHPSTLTSINNLADLLSNKGEYDAAESLYRRALLGREKILGPNHPDTLSSVEGLADLLRKKGNYITAEPLQRRSLEGYEKALGPRHPDTLNSARTLGLLLCHAGKNSESEFILRRTLEEFGNILGARHPCTLSCVGDLGFLLSKTGNYAEAEPLLRHALEEFEKVQGPKHPDTLLIVHNLAGLLSNIGDYDVAAPLFRKALEGRETALGPDHPDTRQSALRVEELLQMMNQQSQ